MKDTISIETRLREHVRGTGYPDIEHTGILSNDWTVTYLQLLDEAVRVCEGEPCLPRGIVADVYLVRMRFSGAYDEWLFNGGASSGQTELNLSQVQGQSGNFLMSLTKNDERPAT
ncbi:MAG TPA: hypothetical protein VK815_02910 [Candidatus Acidoferrales bacterium]|jgi:hypothetical protein|nr:hypothetical protein [Candidatus Acidoferrales bacterium]